MTAIRSALLAGIALAGVTAPTFAQELDVIRIGLLGGENEADRLADNQCLIDKLPAALGVKEVQLFPAADYDGVIQGLLGGTLDVAGDVFVDCNDFKLTGGAVVNFTGGNVVFRNKVTVNSSTLTFNEANPSTSLTTTCATTVVGCTTASSTDAAFVYLRQGTLTLSSATVRIHNSLLYAATGGLDVGSGSTLSWSAPEEGPFKGLALWGESDSATFSI